MNYKDFNMSREHAKRLLSKSDLLKSADFYKKPISGEFIRVARVKDFFNAYLTALKNFDYHFLLFDESFLQLEYNRNSTDNVTLRYAYYQFPYDFPTYKEYLMERDLSFNEMGYGYKYEYEQALSEAPQKDTFVLIRYDYSEREYSPGVHSVSHFHFGHSNSIRIPSSVIITPLLFTLFVLKQVYSDVWKLLIEESNFHRIYKSSKSKCQNIRMCFFDDLDKKELYLK
ncbi:MAG: DUF2290 domain-containing protein [Methanophagales archaeon]|nr:DUF2290 domain-containing protein [Methanophagales archaeon]